jgi:transposase
MRKIRDVLRLKYSAGLSHRQIAAALNLSIGVVSKYLTNAKLAGIVSYPLPDHIGDRELEQMIFPPPSAKEERTSQFVLPDFSYLHQELKRKGVTLQLLWEEYSDQYNESAYSYSQFCSLYREWREKLKTSMRQTHRAGEKMFVDYAGQTVPIVNSVTGEVAEAQIFVAVLGASNYSYAEATLSQSLPDWIGSHVRAFEFFGGVPQLVVPDNLKSGVTRACRYEPEINQTYAEMAAHYQTAVIPARPRKPKDKAKVEVGVQIVERWILARLRKQTFFSLAELNRAIIALVGGLNYRPFKKLPGCRRSAFETIDRPALRPLPADRYIYAEWKKVRVNIDYHVEIDGHYYSVPHSLIKEQLDARLTQRTIEVFHKGERVASHSRSLIKAGHTTLPEHMPKAHRAHLEWTPGRFLNWSLEVGESCRDLVKHLLTARSHPEQGYRSCLGLLSLSRRYGKERLEAACRRALHLGSPTRKSVLSILERGLDRLPLPGEETIDDSAQKPLTHQNIRGAAYYRNKTNEDTQVTNRLQTGH